MDKRLRETRDEAAKAAQCLVDAQAWAIQAATSRTTSFSAWAAEKMIAHIDEARKHADKSIEIAKSLE